jgi:hypothetical protein
MRVRTESLGSEHGNENSRPEIPVRYAREPNETMECGPDSPSIVLLTRSHCEVVWSVCYIPSGKSLACFADLRLHSYESARVAGGTSAPGHSSSPTKCEAQLFTCRAISKLRAHVAQSSCACPRQLFLPVRRRAAQMLTSMSMQSRQPRPRPRGTVGLTQLLGMHLHRCGACSDKQPAMRWP